jgi:hypothetical protein
MESSGSGFIAVVKISRKKLGIILASLGVLVGAFAFVEFGLVLSLVVIFLTVPLAVLFYSGVSRESKVSIARGLVFVYPKTIGNQTTALSESICKPEAIKEEGDAVLVLSRWSQLRIVFQAEAQRTSFISEVSSLLKR